MADQNTPPGGKPGRPFVPPFRGPLPLGGAGGPGERQPAPDRIPRPFVPPAGARPGAASPPAVPRTPAAPLPPALPTAPRPRTPVPFEHEAAPEPVGAEGNAQGGHEALGFDGDSSGAGAGDRSTDALDVEHAISEMLGQGPAAPDPFGLSVERASGEDDAMAPKLPADEVTEEPPSGGPELPLLFPPEVDAPRAGHRGGTPASIEAVELALDAAGRIEEPRGGQRGEAPDGATPIPWLAPPAEAPASPPQAKRELTGATSGESTRYDGDSTRRESPAPAGAAAPAEPRESAESGVIGANFAVAVALEDVARRVRSGELRVPAVAEESGPAGALAAVLAVLLGVRS